MADIRIIYFPSTTSKLVESITVARPRDWESLGHTERATWSKRKLAKMVGPYAQYRMTEII